MPLGAFRQSLNLANPIENSSGTWNALTASYDNISYSIVGQEGNGRGIAFSTDGTKMYLVGTTNDGVFQYNLSTAWDLSTASFNNQGFSIISQDGTSSGLFFKSDGTKMYVIGSASDRVHSYTLSTAWTITSATYDGSGQSFLVSSQEGASTGITFKPDGTRMYVIGSNNTVYNYSLSTAWTVSTASLTNSYSYSSTAGNSRGIGFKDDGTKMYLCSTLNDLVWQYSLSTAWDPSTASSDGSFSFSSQESGVGDDIFIKPTGEKFYILGSTQDKIFQYSFGS